jgi:hypothetical protein
MTHLHKFRLNDLQRIFQISSDCHFPMVDLSVPHRGSCFGALLRLVSSPRVAHIYLWTTFQASYSPSTLFHSLNEFSLSLCRIISPFVL